MGRPNNIVAFLSVFLCAHHNQKSTRDTRLMDRLWNTATALCHLWGWLGFIYVSVCGGDLCGRVMWWDRQGIGDVRKNIPASHSATYNSLAASLQFPCHLATLKCCRRPLAASNTNSCRPHLKIIVVLINYANYNAFWGT